MILPGILAIAGMVLGGLTHVSTAAEPAHMTLIRQLGASSYVERKLAAKQLLDIGIEAKPALMRGIRAQDDLEIRLEAHRLLIKVLQNRFDQRIIAFLNDENLEGDHADLPGWSLFREKVEDTPSTRQLYAEMLRAEHDLLVALSGQEKSLGRLLTKRMKKLPHDSVSEPTLATLLLLTMQAQQGNHQQAERFVLVNRLYSILRRADMKDVVLRGEHATQLKKLLVGWIEEAGGGRQHGNLLKLALDYDLGREGVGIARKILNDPESNSSLVPYAAIMLARFGTVKDVKHLKPHLETEKVFHTWSNRQLKKEPIRIQVRDAVLAMIIRLHQEDPAAYGFKLLKSDDKTIYKVYSLGFLDESQRKAAFKKWKERAKADEKQDQDDAESPEDALEPAAATVTQPEDPPME